MDVQNNLKEKKQSIIEQLRKKGPSLPSAISKEVNLPLLFTSAIFSEMVAEKSIVFSRMRIGGSPLYYIKGQESQLENFVKHLPAKEREAFELLKKELVLNAEKLEPSIRVALNNIKDFAVLMRIKFNDEEKTFWRLHTVLEEEAVSRIEDMLKRTDEKKSKKSEKEKPKEKEFDEKSEIKIREKESIIEKPKKQRKNIRKDAFNETADSWLEKNNFEIIEKLDGKDDAVGVVSVSSSLGKLNFLVIAKTKAKLNETDLSFVYNQGVQFKMPVLLLIKGELTKKADAYLSTLGKYIILKKLNI